MDFSSRKVVPKFELPLRRRRRGNALSFRTNACATPRSKQAVSGVGMKVSRRNVTCSDSSRHSVRLRFRYGEPVAKQVPLREQAG
jgi:hypothetical protein